VAGAQAYKRRGIQPAPDVARLAVGALARGQRTIIPYFGGRVTALLVRFLPVGLITYFIEKFSRPETSSS
jgi:hypothetical protein